MIGGIRSSQKSVLTNGNIIKLLERLKDASKYDASRLKVKIDEEVDRLKGDFIRAYDEDDIEI